MWVLELLALFLSTLCEFVLGGPPIPELRCCARIPGADLPAATGRQCMLWVSGV